MSVSISHNVEVTGGAEGTKRKRTPAYSASGSLPGWGIGKS